MTTEEKKEGAFDPGCVRDIYDTLTTHNSALRAFGALLKSSDLFDFADQGLGERLKSDDYDRQNLRYGLNQLIELYLAHQERILSEYVDKYHESDIYLVNRAAGLVSMVEQGAFKSWEAAANNLREAISILDIVINRNGELQEKALQLKGVCLKYIEQFAGKKAAGV